MIPCTRLYTYTYIFYVYICVVAVDRGQVELPFPSCKLTAEAAGYQDRAENAVGAALEASTSRS